MRKLLQYLLVGTFAIGAAGGLAACSSGDGKAKDVLKDNGVNVDENGNVQISSEDGNVNIGSSSDVPEDFPDGVALPEGGDLTSSFSTDSGEGKSFSLTYSYSNSGDVNDAADAYKSQLKDDGFELSSEFSGSSGGSSGTSFTASNDKYSVTVYAGGDTSAGGDATLLVTVTPASGTSTTGN